MTTTLRKPVRAAVRAQAQPEAAIWWTELIHELPKLKLIANARSKRRTLWMAVTLQAAVPIKKW